MFHHITWQLDTENSQIRDNIFALPNSVPLRGRRIFHPLYVDLVKSLEPGITSDKFNFNYFGTHLKIYAV